MKKTVILALHLGYWLLYVLLLLVIFAGLGLQLANVPRAGWVGLIHPIGTLTVLPNIFAFYGFYTWVFSRFLRKRKILMTVLAGILVCAGSACICLLTLYLTDGKMHGIFHGAWEFTGAVIFLSIVGMIHGTIALVIRGFITWYDDLKVKEALTKKNFEMELALVKSQLDPHFLFNTINNIDVLITKDPERASAYLNRLSDIMRFMLYETKTGQIPLSKELDYIGKFIELQKIRSFNPQYVSYVFSGETDGILIAPMILIPFVENAFKHADGIKTDNAIRVEVHADDSSVRFLCTNKYLPTQGAKPAYSGLGNELIRKRLELLYPQKYQLTIEDNRDIYSVKLVIRPDENELHHHRG